MPIQEIVEKNRCTGCTACMSNCPKDAISMEIDGDGFRYPIVDQEKCIDCKLCKRTCPVLNTTSNNSLNKCYVGYNKDSKERLNASSGSIFSLIANYVLDNNGLVVGAVLDENNHLKHISIDNKKDLDPLKKSKYLQSDLGTIFRDIRKQLKERKVLFVGTPCQVAGIKAYIKNNDNNNLICIDIFCHGVPSPKLFDKYIRELEEINNDKLINYDFRDNSTGWDTYSNKATFKNKEVITDRRQNDYMKLFLSDYALRESCYNCNFKLGNKYSDITLGDFWGVKNYYPEMYNKEGVSAIIINTELGEEIFNKVKDNLEYKECNIREITNGNPSLIGSSKKPESRDNFFKELDSLTINELAKKYKKKISVTGRLKRIIKRILSR